MDETITDDLAEIIRRGAELLEQVDALVQRCVTEPDPDASLARACGAVASEYFAMRKRMWTMSDSPLVAKVEQLLNYEQQVVEQASILAFRPHERHWAQLAARFGDGRREPSAELARLAAELAPAGGTERPPQ